MRMSMPGGWLKGAVAKPRLVLVPVLALVLFLFCFFAGFFLAFPDAVLRDRLVAEVNHRLPPGNRLQAELVSLRFPMQLQARRVTLNMDHAPLSELSLASVTVSPTLASLFGHVGATVSVESELGNLDGTIFQSGEVDLHLRDGRFELPLPGTQLTLAGVISAVDLVGQLQADRGQPVMLKAQLDSLLLSGSSQIGLAEDTLPVGNLSASLNGAGRDLQVEQLNVSGGAIALNGGGRLVLQQPLGASRLDLSLQLRPEPGADPALRSLLELLAPPGADGVHVIQLRGRLQAPQLK